MDKILLGDEILLEDKINKSSLINNYEDLLLKTQYELMQIHLENEKLKHIIEIKNYTIHQLEKSLLTDFSIKTNKNLYIKNKPKLIKKIMKLNCFNNSKIYCE